MMNIISQFDLSFWLLSIFSWSELLPFFSSVAGLEPYMVHSQPGPDPVFPEHSTGLGSLYLSVVAGPFLLPSSLLPWPRTYSDVLSLHRQDGETSHRLWPVFSVLYKVLNLRADSKGKTSASFSQQGLQYEQRYPSRCDNTSRKLLQLVSYYFPVLLRCWVSCWLPLALWSSSISCWRGARRSSSTWSSYSAPSYAAWLW